MVQSELSGAGGRGSSGDDDRLRHVVMEGFIFHAATSVPFNPLPEQQTANLNPAIQLAQGALDTMPSRADTLGHPDSPVLGAPPGLFVLVREISLMHRAYELRRADDDGRLQPCQELKAQLSQYRSLYQKGLSLTGFPDTANTAVGAGTTSSNNPAFLGPTLYIIAAEILLADMLRATHNGHHHNSMQTPFNIPSLVSEGVRLVSLLQPATDYYAEYYGWPIYVLVRFASRQRDRGLLLSRVEAFREATRNGTMARLAAMLRGNPS
ncbi:hypothetical protein ASPCAL01361 [Aspergillus calidoustus]|uniref:C6 finger domain protein n=1 Tax=Aspergillus calidoustus TaxID=454130 RepID=A0A0U5FT15_ASPCI|nr:hypothetical protein ASPCAL01361 [Aspergillus calidoustus]